MFKGLNSVLMNLVTDDSILLRYLMTSIIAPLFLHHKHTPNTGFLACIAVSYLLSNVQSSTTKCVCLLSLAYSKRETKSELLSSVFPLVICVQHCP